MHEKLKTSQFIQDKLRVPLMKKKVHQGPKINHSHDFGLQT